MNILVLYPIQASASSELQPGAVLPSPPLDRVIQGVIGMLWSLVVHLLNKADTEAELAPLHVEIKRLTLAEDLANARLKTVNAEYTAATKAHADQKRRQDEEVTRLQTVITGLQKAATQRDITWSKQQAQKLNTALADQTTREAKNRSHIHKIQSQLSELKQNEQAKARLVEASEEIAELKAEVARLQHVHDSGGMVALLKEQAQHREHELKSSLEKQTASIVRLSQELTESRKRVNNGIVLGLKGFVPPAEGPVEENKEVVRLKLQLRTAQREAKDSQDHAAEVDITPPVSLFHTRTHTLYIYICCILHAYDWICVYLFMCIFYGRLCSQVLEENGHLRESVAILEAKLGDHTLFKELQQAQQRSELVSDAQHLLLQTTPYFGLRSAPYPYDVERLRDVFVVNVTAGGPSFRAGLRSGCVVTSVNGIAVTDPEMMHQLCTAIRPGETASFEVILNGSIRYQPRMCHVLVPARELDLTDIESLQEMAFGDSHELSLEDDWDLFHEIYNRYEQVLRERRDRASPRRSGSESPRRMMR